jgi:hypothetical protein
MMASHYTCGKCKKLLPATEEHFFPNSLLKVAKDVNRVVIGQCKPCAKQYSAQWRASIKVKGLTRSRKRTRENAHAVHGIIYVIGTSDPGNPYKIGVTAGSDTTQRKAALQTSHWMELTEVWKSDVLRRVDKIEKKLHKHFEKKWVRGEWFNLDLDDINDMSSLVEHFGVEE